MSKDSGGVMNGTAHRSKGKRRYSGEGGEDGISRKRSRVDSQHARSFPPGFPDWAKKLRRLTQEDRERLRNEDKCFACRKGGHGSGDAVCELYHFGSRSRKSGASSNTWPSKCNDVQDKLQTPARSITGRAATPLVATNISAAHQTHPLVKTQRKWEDDKEIRNGMREARKLARRAKGTTSSNGSYESRTGNPALIVKPASGPSSHPQLYQADSLFFEDRTGYETIPSTAARNTVQYERHTSGAVLGHQVKHSSELHSDRNVGSMLAETEAELALTQGYHADKHSRVVDEGYGSADSPPDTSPNFLPLNSSRESTPDLATFIEARPTMALDRSQASTVKKFYGIRFGRKTGIYFKWSGPDQAEAQVKRFPDSRHQSFKRLEDAVTYVNHSARDCNDLCCQPAWNRAEELQRAHRECMLKQASLSCPEKVTAPVAEVKPPNFEHLCDEQRSLVDRILEGHNVFYTGSAGTGKSTVLKAFVEGLRYANKKVAIVAPTGIAALNVNGQTYFTWAGWLPDSKKKHIDVLMKDSRSSQRWRRLNETDVLVIDEISMLENHQFERVDRVCRYARASNENDTKTNIYHDGSERSPHDPSLPFGGMQIIVTGDFCQLPPVRPFKTCFPCGKELAERGEKYCYHCRFAPDDQWAFRSAAWPRCRFHDVELTQIHRQSDPDFIDILNTLRAGLLPSQDQIQLLLNHESETTDAVRLYPKNREADEENVKGLAKIGHPKRTFRCHDHHDWQQDLHPLLKLKMMRNEDGNLRGCDDHRFPAKLEMKVGMLVMLVSNLDQENGLVNGSQGILVTFVKYNPGIGSCKTNCFQPAVGENANYRDERVREWTAGQESVDSCNTKYLPLVHFANGQRRVVPPVCQVSSHGDEEPYSLLSRTQIPLLPAWAITIHKSQGMTLDKVIINLDGSFEREMVYVALSRVRGLSGLKIETSDGLKVLREGGRLAGGNQVVKEFRERCFGKAITRLV